MKKIRITLAALAAVIGLAVATPIASADFNYCPTGGSYAAPSGGQCQTYVGNGSTTYLNVGNASYYTTYTYYNGTDANFVNWTKNQLSIPQSNQSVYSQATIWTTRLSNTSVDLWVHAYYPYPLNSPGQRRYCFWHRVVSGSNANPYFSSILDSGCSTY